MNLSTMYNWHYMFHPNNEQSSSRNCLYGLQKSRQVHETGSTDELANEREMEFTNLKSEAPMHSILGA